jgi:hypothetical protein
MASSCCASAAARGVVGDQAFDAQRHVGQPAGGVDARAEREAEVEGRGARRLAPAPPRTAPPPGLHAAGADALQALRHQAAVVGVQPHHVGHRAQGHQVQQRVQRGCDPASKRPRSRSSARVASST